MNTDLHQPITPDILQRLRSGQLPRRDALRLLTGLSLAAVGAGAIGMGTISTRAISAPPAIPTQRHGGHGGWNLKLLRQENGTPEPAATPPLGERPDGTRIWRIGVAGMDMEAMIDTQAFFPSELTINAGDAVFFEFPTPPGFHTVTFLSGDEVPPVLVPDETGGSPAADPPKLVINPVMAFPSGGDTYDGSGYVNSGLDVLRLPDDPPFVLTFTTPGTYEYQCIPHGAVMKATIIVQEPGATLPEDQASVDARAEEERAALLDEGQALITEYGEATSTPRDDGTTLWEVAAGVGEGQARVFDFLPRTLEIKAGDTIRWINYSKTEPHSVTFLGEGVEQPEDVLIEPQASGPPTMVQNPLTLFPQGEAVYSGQGYVNSGLMGELNGELLPGGLEYELTFDTTGEYPYYCVLHASGPEGPGMVGTITVE